MKALRLTTITALVCLLAACGEEKPPRSVDELVASPFLLEAAMVRCAQDRSKTKYDQECLNAREAGNRLAAEDREERQEFLEAQSARKRQALRRTQEAVAEARRRAAEARRRREEAEYLGLFETLPGEGPIAAMSSGAVDDAQSTAATEMLPDNQPGVVIMPLVPAGEAEASTELPVATDIKSIREELKKRQDRSD